MQSADLTRLGRMVRSRAGEAAQGFGHLFIEPIHLLLALLRVCEVEVSSENDYMLALTRLLSANGLTSDTVYDQIMRLEDMEASAERPIPMMAESASAVLDIASLEAASHHFTTTDTKHILLGLLVYVQHEGSGDKVAKVLEELDVDCAALYDEVLRTVFPDRGTVEEQRQALTAEIHQKEQELRELRARRAALPAKRRKSPTRKAA